MPVETPRREIAGSRFRDPYLRMVVLLVSGVTSILICSVDAWIWTNLVSYHAEAHRYGRILPHMRRSRSTSISSTALRFRFNSPRLPT